MALNVHMDDGNTPLTKAIIDGDVKTVDMILNDDKDVRYVHISEKNCGMTPFLLAAHINDVDIMRKLYHAGADHKERVFVNYADKYIFMDGTLVNANAESWDVLQVAVMAESIDVIEYLIEVFNKVLNNIY